MEQIPPEIAIAIRVASALWPLIRGSLWKLTTLDPVQRAIRQTAESFSEFPDLSVQLSRYCDSDEFADLLTCLETSGRSMSPDAIVDSFVQEAAFHAGDESHEKASEVVAHFMERLDDELLS